MICGHINAHTRGLCHFSVWLSPNDSFFSNRKIKITTEDLNEYMVRRYYDEKAEVRERHERLLPACATPPGLQAKPLVSPPGRKLHYKLNDGSSFL